MHRRHALRNQVRVMAQPRARARPRAVRDEPRRRSLRTRSSGLCCSRWVLWRVWSGGLGVVCVTCRRWARLNQTTPLAGREVQRRVRRVPSVVRERLTYERWIFQASTSCPSRDTSSSRWSNTPALLQLAGSRQDAQGQPTSRSPGGRAAWPNDNPRRGACRPRRGGGGLRGYRCRRHPSSMLLNG